MTFAKDTAENVATTKTRELIRFNFNDNILVILLACIGLVYQITSWLNNASTNSWFNLSARSLLLPDLASGIYIRVPGGRVGSSCLFQ